MGFDVIPVLQELNRVRKDFSPANLELDPEHHAHVIDYILEARRIVGLATLREAVDYAISASSLWDAREIRTLRSRAGFMDKEKIVDCPHCQKLIVIP